MALSDLVVVMNQGRIEQAGTPREVFSRPNTAFVARFIGGHNVIAAPGGMVAVRVDRMRLSPGAAPATPLSLGARVETVEYQGSFVQLRLRALDAAPGTAELFAVMPDDAFAARPFAVGDAVTARWEVGDAHSLRDAQPPADAPALEELTP